MAVPMIAKAADIATRAMAAPRNGCSTPMAADAPAGATLTPIHRQGIRSGVNVALAVDVMPDAPLWSWSARAAG